jgi:GH35 family endo-1,4-beta-xylanase
MKHVYFSSIVVLLCILFAFNLVDLHAQLPVPEGRRLRDIIADKYPEGNLLIGATTGSWGIGEPIGEVMDREFSYVTPENDFKQSVVRGDHSIWNWSRADAWLQHIKDNDQVLRIHGPISPQCSKWAKEDHRTADELSQELDTFMTALCKRYNDVEGIEYLDVVNEIALSDGKWHHPKPGTDQWENPWLTIGQDTDPNKTPLYVKRAFAIANEHAPELKQIINNHCHPGTPGMEKVKETIVYLRDSGYRVDGLGWQAHVEVGWATEENLNHLRDVIDWCQQRNLEFHITEFDAWIMNKYTQTFEDQAYTYKAIMDVMLEKLDTLTMGWNTWHITDAAGWKTERLPSLFDDKYRPKPAYYAFQLALETKGNYSTIHKVTFKAKNAETGEPVSGFQSTFNDAIKNAGEQELVSYSDIHPGRYTVQIERSGFNTLIKKSVNIYRDTTITLMLHPAEYQTTFQLVEERTRNNLASVDVVIDTLGQKTILDGTATFLLKPGTYHTSFSKNGYASEEHNFNISSDTTITVALKSTHGDIKFSLKENNQPVHDALITFENESIYSNALGIGTFEFLPLDSLYTYAVQKEGFEEVSGTIFLQQDTTVTIQLKSLLANVRFEIMSDHDLEDIGMIVFKNDTSPINASKSASFYNYEVEESYAFQLLVNENVIVSDTVFITSDTTITLTYSPTSVASKYESYDVQVYPNPASNYIQIKSEIGIESITILDANGRPIRGIHPAHNQIIDVSSLVNGHYYVQIKLDKISSHRLYPVIVH